MPQKYGKHMQVMPGFKPDREKLKAVDERIDERREKEKIKRRHKVFMVEPEELKILDALDRLPPEQRQDAAEGLLISRVARRKGFIK